MHISSKLSVAVATALMSAAAPSFAATPVVLTGVVSGSYFNPPVISDSPTTSAPSSTVASTYAGATVCLDTNGNGQCDAGEPTTTTNASGVYKLLSTSTVAAGVNLVAMVPTTATNNGHVITGRTVFRVHSQQITAATGAPLAPITAHVTPLSTEITRMIENDGATFAVAQSNLAERLGVTASEVIANPNTITAGDQAAYLAEAVALTNRFTLAASMFDHGDYATIKQAQQGAMALEGIPRYDHIFIVMLENKATLTIKGSQYAPNLNAYLAANNQFTNYYATGNPSEPNYTALGGADDWGITDDNQWNCGATGANAVQDAVIPTNSAPGLASSPFTNPCTQSTNHNIVGHANLFNAMSSNGLTWRTYNESMNPGQDPRIDSVADSAISAPDHVYAANAFYTGSTAKGDATGVLPMPAQLYRTKHHPGMAYQNVRSAPEFFASNRTMGGGQWDANLLNGTKYAIPAGFNSDQFGSDLTSGAIGQLNFVIPDQCDDMHGITVSGKDSVSGATITASDCASISNNASPTAASDANAIVTRSDKYVKYLVNKIQASPVWNNPQKRVAIVLMFDEGNSSGTSTSSCCGWNPNTTVDKPVVSNAAGTSVTVDTSIAGYNLGNRGHGNSIFVVLNNQSGSPKQIVDSDAYSHFSFVRTLQDMFGLANPDQPGTYMNRSKYTESFIATNILNLPEYASAADTHFNAVRPMNHAYVIPGTYTEKQSADQNTTPQVGPDATQINIWTLPASVQ